MKRKGKTIALIFCGLAVATVALMAGLRTKAVPVKEQLPEKYRKEIGKYGEDVSIFVDFSLPSSGHRFFVYDRRKEKVIARSKCAHGSGGGSTVSKPVFSNKPGSECSCLGDFRLLRNDRMRSFDAACIRIEGLSATNSNAYSRGVVIHEGPGFADDISLGIPIPMSRYISQGCFTISSRTFSLLQTLVKEKKTIYLYARYPEK